MLALKEFDVDIETVNVTDYTSFPYRNKVVPTGKLIIKFDDSSNRIIIRVNARSYNQLMNAIDHT